MLWTRADSAAVRRYEEDKTKPENISRRHMNTSLIWLQDVNQTTPLDIQEGRIKRWLKEDTAVRVGEAAAEAMRFHIIEWQGDRFQWS
eukprot:6891736-Prymnesium_polylepis.2